MYKVRYLPLALSDLRDITDYIIDILKAPKAAADLLDAMDESISRLEQFPYSYKVFQSVKETENEYRILQVKNYAIFYVVNGDIVEIHRIVYAKRELTKIIK